MAWLPEVGCISVPRMVRSVLLPDPDGPEQRRQLARLHGRFRPAQDPRLGLARAEGLDQIAHLQKRRHWPIAVTGSSRAAARAGRIEARMAPSVVSRIASP